MPMPLPAAVATQIRDAVGDGPEGLAKWDGDRRRALQDMIKAGSVLPTALLAPPGVAGGPVTGTGTIT